MCLNGAGAYVWTRKRVVPVACDIRIGDRRIEVEATGIEDESAGYHPRHTVWSWSAGVGRLTDGRPVGWNLVEGVNDPPERSERAIWVDGEPLEPGPVSFDGLDAVTFDDGSRLDFAAEAERVATEDRRLVRIAYRQPFGTFTGALAGGLRLERGLGVMEHQDAPGSSHPAYTLATRQRHGGSSPGGKSTWLRPASVSSGTSRGGRYPRAGHRVRGDVRGVRGGRICSQPSVEGIEPVVQHHGVVLAPAVVDCEERGDPAVGRGQLRALARQRAARATTVAEVHGQEAPTATGSGASAWATPPSERPQASVSGSRPAGARQPGRAADLPGDGGSQLACLAARRRAAARRRPRRPAPRSAAPAGVLDGRRRAAHREASGHGRPD